MCTHGDSSCCTYEEPCDLGEGDCDYDYQCRGKLVCGNSNCRHRALRGYDCCQKRDVAEVMYCTYILSKHLVRVALVQCTVF